jgi:putative membrane protein
VNRMLSVAGVYLGANALGLLLASILFDDFRIDGLGFVIALVIFTVVEVVADAVVEKAAADQGGIVRAATALISTFVGLLVTDVISDGLDIEGAGTWVLATLVVFAAALVGTFVLGKLLLTRDRT